MKQLNDYLLPIVALLFTVIGIILATYLTFTYRQKSLTAQTKLKELSEEINSLLAKVKIVNDEINYSTKNTEKLASDIDGITKKIHSTQIELSVLTEGTKKVSEENLALTKNIKEITENIKTIQTNLSTLTSQNHEIINKSSNVLNDLKDFSTGGDTFIELGAGLEYDDDITKPIGYNLRLRVRGERTMRNVKIKILDNYYQKHKRKEYQVKEYMKQYVVRNNGLLLELHLGDVPYYQGYGIGLQNLDDYDGDMEFTCIVEAENFVTQQVLIIYDMYESRKQYNHITIQRGPRGGEVLYSNSWNFPLNEKGLPIRKQK